MFPEEEVRGAPEFVMFEEPERVMSPVAAIAPVGATVVPPAISTTPSVAVREAEPA
jgi:hypothetical protein